MVEGCCRCRKNTSEHGHWFLSKDVLRPVVNTFSSAPCWFVQKVS